MAGQVILVLATINFNMMWLILYSLCIRRGQLDKSFGIPVVALCANFAWDVFSSTNGQAMPMPQPIINAIYVVMDLIIMSQALRYWQKDFSFLTALQYYVFFAFTLFFTFWLMGSFMYEVNDIPTWRIAFIDTFINSALFIAMFYRRPNLEGQSIYIGLCKLWGTGLFMLILYFAPQLGVADYIGLRPSLILPPLWVGIFLLDLAYVVLVYQRAKTLGINVWAWNNSKAKRDE